MDVVKRNGRWVPVGGDVVPEPGEPVGLDCSDLPSMTRQSESKACDINEIMRRYEVTGQLPEFRDGAFLDVSEMPDYRTALDTVSRANEMFLALPAQVREAFKHDPAVFLDEYGDDTKREKMVALGLLPEDKPAESKPVAKAEPKGEPAATDKPAAGA